jgi:hypothetical protein
MRTGGVAAAVGLVLAGCAPAHDWRETRSADGAVEALFPCRPQLHERRVALSGGEAKLSLLACEAGGQTWALATADLSDPARHAQALDELAAAAATNIGAAPRAMPLQVPGAMAHAGSRRLVLEGRRPDGQPVQMQLAVFAHGTRIYQATALGQQVPAALADHFIASLRVAP